MTSRDEQANIAARALYQSIHYKEESSERAPRSRMSPVRRTFSLMVVADLGLIFILWVIYTQLEGDFWYTLKHQILGYDIQTSMFDIVMSAIIRFVLLLLGYALLRLSHWWMVALTCLLTNSLLVAKVFLFCFSESRDPTICKGHGNNYMAFVLLIACFVMAWIEVYMIDFKVLPKEARMSGNTSIVNGQGGEREPLLRNESIAASSPREYHTPDISDDEEEAGARSVNRLSPQDEHYSEEAEASWQCSRNLLLNRELWKLQRLGNTDEDASVYTQTVQGTGKMLLIELQLPLSPQALFTEMYHGLEASPTWNPTVLEAKVLHRINDHTDIAWSLAADAVGGAVKSRDFVCLRHFRKHGDVIISTGASTEYSGKPPTKGIIRADNKRGTCWAFSPVPANPHACRFTWIACVNLKGWLPQSVVDTAITSTLLEFINHLKRRIAGLNEQ